MSKPIAPATGIAFAFPDVCLTPAGPVMIPVPYPNVAQLADADTKSDTNGGLLVGGEHVLLEGAVISSSTGDEAGSGGGVISGTTGATGGECKLVQASGSVLYGPEGKGIVRFLDQTTQNKENVQGMVLSANPTVLVGD